VHGQRSANCGEFPDRATCTGVQNGDGSKGHRIDDNRVPIVEEGQLFLQIKGKCFYFFIIIAVLAIRLVFCAVTPTGRIRKQCTKLSIRHVYVIWLSPIPTSFNLVSFQFNLVGFFLSKQRQNSKLKVESN